MILIAYLYILALANSYPQGSLECFSTLTRPDRRLICPESRNNFCVKEVSNLPQSLCGKTQYFGDRFVSGQCVYKKCESECVEEEYKITFDTKDYNRKRYCCNDKNLCNDGKSLISNFNWIIVLALNVFVVIVYFN